MIADLAAASRDAYELRRWLTDLGIGAIRVAPGRAGPLAFHDTSPWPRELLDLVPRKWRAGAEATDERTWTPRSSVHYILFWCLYVDPPVPDDDGARIYRIRPRPRQRALGLDEPPGLVEITRPGDELLRAGRPREALRAYLRARASVPGLPALDAAIARCHLRLGELEAAERSFLRAISQAGPVPDLYDSLGETYRALGRRADAAASFERAAGFDPDSAERWIKAARALDAAGLATAARAAVRRALAREPADPRALKLERRMAPSGK